MSSEAVNEIAQEIDDYYDSLVGFNIRVMGAKEVAAIIDSALDTARDEGRSEAMTQAAGIVQGHAERLKVEPESTERAAKIATAVYLCTQILTASPDPNFADKIRDGAYEAAALECDDHVRRTRSEIPRCEASGQSSSELRTRANSLTTVATAIRALKSTQGK